jgi:hypothetical protein
MMVSLRLLTLLPPWFLYDKNSRLRDGGGCAISCRLGTKWCYSAAE